MKLLFYDLETTGFGFEKCAIIQLAAIVVEFGTDFVLKPIDAINLKMRPRSGKMVDKRSLEINNYSLNEILKWQDDSLAFQKFINFISKHVNRYDSIDKLKLCGYNNVHFDNDFLREWFKENGDNFFGSYFFSDSIDVLCEASRWLTFYRPALNNFKLGNVANVMSIKFDENTLHDGLADVKLTFKIFKKIIDSGKLFLEFDETLATKIFDEQIIAKSKEKPNKSKFTENDAWITVS